MTYIDWGKDCHIHIHDFDSIETVIQTNEMCDILGLYTNNGDVARKNFLKSWNLIISKIETARNAMDDHPAPNEKLMELIKEAKAKQTDIFFKIV